MPFEPDADYCPANNVSMQHAFTSNPVEAEPLLPKRHPIPAKETVNLTSHRHYDPISASAMDIVRKPSKSSTNELQPIARRPTNLPRSGQPWVAPPGYVPLTLAEVAQPQPQRPELPKVPPRQTLDESIDQLTSSAQHSILAGNQTSNQSKHIKQHTPRSQDPVAPSAVGSKGKTSDGSTWPHTFHQQISKNTATSRGDSSSRRQQVSDAAVPITQDLNDGELESSRRLQSIRQQSDQFDNIRERLTDSPMINSQHEDSSPAILDTKASQNRVIPDQGAKQTANKGHQTTKHRALDTRSEPFHGSARTLQRQQWTRGCDDIPHRRTREIPGGWEPSPTPTPQEMQQTVPVPMPQTEEESAHMDSHRPQSQESMFVTNRSGYTPQQPPRRPESRSSRYEASTPNDQDAAAQDIRFGVQEPSELSSREDSSSNSSTLLAKVASRAKKMVCNFDAHVNTAVAAEKDKEGEEEERAK